jgi:hypothetical protein
MICNAKDLSPDQKAAIETLLGRRIQEDEAVSVRTFEPVAVSHQRRLEIANELRKYFAVRVGEGLALSANAGAPRPFRETHLRLRRFSA